MELVLVIHPRNMNGGQRNPTFSSHGNFANSHVLSSDHTTVPRRDRMSEFFNSRPGVISDEFECQFKQGDINRLDRYVGMWDNGHPSDETVRSFYFYLTPSHNEQALISARNPMTCFDEPR